MRNPKNKEKLNKKEFKQN